MTGAPDPVPHPKIELHVHLEGALRPSILREIARRNGVSLGELSLPEVDAMIVSQLEWPAHSLNKPMTDGCEKTSPKLIAARSQFPNQSDSYDSWRPDE